MATDIDWGRMLFGKAKGNTRASLPRHGVTVGTSSNGCVDVLLDGSSEPVTLACSNSFDAGESVFVAADGETYVVMGGGSGGSGSFTETDPTVPAWAKEPKKPTYTAEEVGAASKDHAHDQYLTELPTHEHEQYLTEVPSEYVTETELADKGYVTADHAHDASDITSGTLTLAQGGTGAALSRTANAIIRYSSNSDKFSSTATKSGALYATASNGSPQFGTLPIAQGGTGATDAATALANIGAAASAHSHSEYALLGSGNTYGGEQKFQHPDYCPFTPESDTASGVGCAFKGTRGLVNELLADKLVMTASTGKLPIYSYSGTSDGQMLNPVEVASFSGVGRLKANGVSVGSNGAGIEEAENTDGTTGAVTLLGTGARPYYNYAQEIALLSDVQNASDSRFLVSMIPDGTQIYEYADLNSKEFLKVGNYFCRLDAYIPTLSNCPCDNAFLMQVYSPLSTTVDNEDSAWIYRVRKITTYLGVEYIQYCNTGGTAGVWNFGAWQTIAKLEDMHNFASSFVSKHNDILLGSLAFANGTWNPVGDDAYFGDNNTAGSFAIKGANGTTNLKMVAYNGTAAGTLSWDGSSFAFSAPLSGYATTAQLSSYIPTSGGQIPGNIVIENSNPHLGLMDTSGATAYFQTHNDGSGLKAGFGFGWSNSIKIDTSGKLTQGTPSNDSSISLMNRFESDLYVKGNGSAPNTPTVAGFYLGKSTSDENRHMDIVSGGDYAYIDFNKAGVGSDYEVRLLVNVSSGYTDFCWGGGSHNPTLNIQGDLTVGGKAVATMSDIPSLSGYVKNNDQQTITAVSDTPLYVKSLGSNAAYVGFTGNAGSNGYLGVNNGTPVFYDNQNRTILHAGNYTNYLVNSSAAVLYPFNASGTNQPVPLSSSAANYSILEIFYTDGSRIMSQRVYSPNGRTTILERSVFSSTSAFYNGSAIVTISGTSITWSNQGRLVIGTGSNQTVEADTGTLKVVCVLGWK